MKITSVDPIYLRMPEITTAADGTQDTILVRIRTDRGLEGWGECDASPLVSIAGMSSHTGTSSRGGTMRPR